MRFCFRDKCISGVLAVVPSREVSFVDEMRNFNFPEHRSLKMKEVMGYDRRRIVEAGVCVSDLAVFGLENLFATGKVARDEIDALILVTQSPDYFMPPTSNVVQGRLGLKTDMLCLDINQGCAGFVVGLIQAFMLLDQESVRKVALINADVISRRTSPKDRNSYPLVGDAASVAIIERDCHAGGVHANIRMDGARHEALMIPAGGFRLPSTPETAVMMDDGASNLRALDHLRMDGSAVFNFVQMEIPELIESLLEDATTSLDKIDYFLCHQPNRFMLQKLADRLGIPHSKMPMNVVEKYGNSSGVTIPLAMTANIGNILCERKVLTCLCGFGVGLTWASMLMNLGQLRFCEIIQYP